MSRRLCAVSRIHMLHRAVAAQANEVSKMKEENKWDENKTPELPHAFEVRIEINELFRLNS